MLNSSVLTRTYASLNTYLDRHRPVVQIYMAKPPQSPLGMNQSYMLPLWAGTRIDQFQSMSALLIDKLTTYQREETSFILIDSEKEEKSNLLLKEKVESFALLKSGWVNTFTSKSWEVTWTVLLDARNSEDPKSSLINKVESFALLESGWASTNSVPPNSAAISQACQFIDLLPVGTTLPHISVAEDGEINFFWRSDSTYIDVGFYGDNLIHYFARADESDIDKEMSELFLGRSLPRELVAAISMV